ncbi:zinc-binding dehydrogenase [Oceanobacillus sp. CFH 90083]|uniref:zinc-dependent alcohol dehydrogenase n=1 Tax=Oceanobacillus sp. CFH 90083 TaxID=2592336 RepID=UPI00128DA5FA|nr:zinc-binding dehydrogenase [Oceanobacillus sp. CFH 90083]
MRTLTVNENGVLERIEIEKPSYNEKQALVKVLSCGICGTDQTLIDKSFKGVPAEDYPIMLGHEAVGRVVETGTEVTSFKKGDVVLLPFNDPREGLGSAWGGFSEYGVINDAAAFKGDEEVPEAAYAQQVIPPDIDHKYASIFITLREVYSAIQYFNIRADEKVLVYGSGPVALAFLRLMKLAGVQEVAVVVRNSDKEQLMQQNGADYIINTNSSDVKQEVKKLFPDGVDKVLDAVGLPAIINEGLSLIKDRGEILCYGVPKKNSMELDWSEAPYNWKINFQQMPSKEEEGAVFEEIIEFVREGKLDLEDYVSDIFQFEEVETAFEKLKNKEILKKAIIMLE